jgi:cytoskeletal protein CcmA (bactofilin family)
MFSLKSSNNLLNSSEKFDTMIGESSEVYGRLVLTGSTRIDGKVFGNIEAPPEKKVQLYVGQTGEVSGDISAYQITVEGKIEGNVMPTERAIFRKTAVIHGDITYGDLLVAHGAKLMGLIMPLKTSARSLLEPSNFIAR